MTQSRNKVVAGFWLERTSKRWHPQQQTDKTGSNHACTGSTGYNVEPGHAAGKVGKSRDFPKVFPKVFANDLDEDLSRNLAKNFSRNNNAVDLF